MKVIVLALSLFAIAYAAPGENEGGVHLGNGLGSSALLGVFGNAAQYGRQFARKGINVLESVADKFSGNAGSLGVHGSYRRKSEGGLNVSGSAGKSGYGNGASGNVEVGKEGGYSGKSGDGVTVSGSAGKSGYGNGASGQVGVGKDAGYSGKSGDGVAVAGSAGKSDSASGSVAVNGEASKDVKVAGKASS